MAGLDCLVFTSAEKTAEAERDTFLSRLYGAEIRYPGAIDEATRGARVQTLAQDLRAKGCRPCIIGKPAPGALGYVRAAEELWQQSDEAGAGLSHVFLPGSMGSTEAGFLHGNARLGHPFTVHLVSVEYDKAELTARIDAILKAITDLTGGEPVKLADGVLPEHTYTAKTLAALFNLARRGLLPADEPNCAIHTGGVPALFSQFGLFATL